MFFLDYFPIRLVNVFIYHSAMKLFVLTQEGTDGNGSRGIKEARRTMRGGLNSTATICITVSVY